VIEEAWHLVIRTKEPCRSSQSTQNEKWIFISQVWQIFRC